MILKNFWSHRRHNGFIFTEIVIITFLSFWVVDFAVIKTYDIHICHADGDIDKKHLVLGYVSRDDYKSEIDIAKLHNLRNKILKLPEVKSVSFIDRNNNGTWNFSNQYSHIAPEADTLRTCKTCKAYFKTDEHFFETFGITSMKGSPRPEELSKDCPDDGVILTRSLAKEIFGTEGAIGKRIISENFHWEGNSKIRTLTHHTVKAIVKDIKPNCNERYNYMAFFPDVKFGGDFISMYIRLKPDIKADDFIEMYNNKNNIWIEKEYNMTQVYSYDNEDKGEMNKNTIHFSFLATLGGLFILNVVIGTLGTFWLQIRKRTGDFGIMRSFGAKRKHIFLTIWGEGVLLTTAACLIGQILWLQIALITGLYQGQLNAVSGRETDWTMQFWSHYLIVCAVQYLFILIIVTLGIITPSIIAMYKKPVDALRYE